jgi:hypothetical protein
LKFKERILAHVKDLTGHLESYLRSEFLNKVKSIQQEIINIKGKLEMEVRSIDDVIVLLDYIASLVNQDKKITEIIVMIDDIAKRMQSLDKMQIIFPEVQFLEYLNLRNWPSTFKKYIEVRKSELQVKKEDLFHQMRNEIEEIFKKI